VNGRDWTGGKVESDAELDAADRAFWDDAGPEARFCASIELAFQAWILGHSDEVPPRFGRDAFGVRKHRRLARSRA
jgi:hypothetical protein